MRPDITTQQRHLTTNGEVEQMTSQYDLRTDFDTLDSILLDEYQSGFPICRLPFRAIADECEFTPAEIVDRIRAASPNSRSTNGLSP